MQVERDFADGALEVRREVTRADPQRSRPVARHDIELVEPGRVLELAISEDLHVTGRVGRRGVVRIDDDVDEDPFAGPQGDLEIRAGPEPARGVKGVTGNSVRASLVVDL